MRELTTAVLERNQGQALWTFYRYDPLKQIAEVVDAVELGDILMAWQPVLFLSLLVCTVLSFL